MSESEHVETSSQSWFGRLCNACGGIVTGIVLIIVAFPVLIWNEGRSVRRYRALREGSGVVVPVPSDSVDPTHEGDLVHLTGMARAGSNVSDPTFGVGPVDGALKLKRDVEMYQWVEDRRTETRKKSGGGKEKTTTYSYDKEWRSDVVNSGSFYKSQGHENPSDMPFPAFRDVADPITVGAFVLPNSIVGMCSWYASLSPSMLSVDNIPDGPVRDNAKLYGGGFYFGDPYRPQVGDARVSFDVVREDYISLLARQAGGTLAPYVTKNGGNIFLLDRGALSAEAMFERAHAANRTTAWLLRLVGFALMFFGFNAILEPLEVAADIIPCVGDIVGAGLNVVAGVLAFLLSTIVIAVAWVAYRPLICVPVLVVAGGLMFVLWKRDREAKSKKQAYQEVSAEPGRNEPYAPEIMPHAQPVGTTYDPEIVVMPPPDDK